MHFAASPAHALDFAHRDAHSRKHLFLRSVLCGTHSKVDSTLKVSPALPGGDDGELHD